MLKATNHNVLPKTCLRVPHAFFLLQDSLKNVVYLFIAILTSLKFCLKINYCWLHSTSSLSPRAGRTLTSLRNLCLASASGSGALAYSLLLFLFQKIGFNNCSHSRVLCVLFFLFALTLISNHYFSSSLKIALTLN